MLFHDDATLSDDEDASPHSLSYARRVLKLPDNIDLIRSDKTARQVWTRAKTDVLIDFTRYLANKVRIYRGGIKTARNLYALPILQQNSEEWFAHSLPKFLANYDYTAVMAMPLMEQAEDPDAWLLDLVRAVKIVPGA